MDVAGLRDVKEAGRHRSLIRRLDDGHDVVVTFRPVRADNLEAARLIRFADCGGATDGVLDLLQALVGELVEDNVAGHDASFRQLPPNSSAAVNLTDS